VVPGFNDAHLHAAVVPPQAVPLQDVKSIEVLVSLLKQKESSDSRQWITGLAYDDTALGRHLTRQDLDRVSTTQPVLALHASMHLYVVNSVALRRAALPVPLQDPEGGRFYRDEDGELTGLISEKVALQMLFNEKQQSPFIGDLESALAGLREFYRRALSQGITSFSDAMVPKELAAAYYLSDPEQYGVRVNLMLDGEDLEAVSWIARLQNLAAMIGWYPLSNDWLRANTVKLFHGMSLSGRTARQYEAYHGRPDYFGEEPQHNQQELNELVARVHELGYQAAVHSNGDYEIDRVLNAIEAAAAVSPREHRHRIEHASIVNTEILQRMRELNVVMAPHSYIYEKGPMIETYGEALWPRMFANASSFEYGIPNAANSDYPVSALSPLLRIQSLVTRRSRAGKVYGPSQRLSIEQALHAYTMGGAIASFEEQRKGSISVGKFADFVILDDDPRRVKPEALKDIAVYATYSAGIKRYQRDSDN
jgi:predicted amidohydrolase YtcJ